MNKQQIATKNFLMRAYRVDQRIENKMEQIANLHDLATKATVTYSDMPKVKRYGSRIEDAVIKIMELEESINKDIMELVKIKTQIMEAIKAVEDPELQLLLEMRYINYVGWEQIAVRLEYSIDNVFKLHKKALDSVTVPESLQ